MAHEWHQLTDLTAGKQFTVTKVRLKDSDIEIEGDFELPPLAGLRYEDQVFVGEFVRCHGSIKHMEKAFSVSYPTIKNRLNRIADQLQLVHIEAAPEQTTEVLDMLDAGEITAAEALKRLRG